MDPFKPKGAVPEWKLAYRLTSTKTVDDVITYDELDQALGRPFKNDRAPIYRAQKEMLEQDHQTLVNVPKVGYRVAQANEHADLAVRQRTRARRAISKGVRIIDGTDRSKLTPTEQRRLTELEVNMKAQSEMLRRTEKRVSILEKQTAKQDDRLDLLIAELRRKGIDVAE